MGSRFGDHGTSFIFYYQQGSRGLRKTISTISSFRSRAIGDLPQFQRSYRKDPSVDSLMPIHCDFLYIQSSSEN